jgi:hypothetical protein
MAAAVAACIEGTWTDWSAEDGAVIPKPEYCITIQPLEGQQAQGQGQQPLLFGVHIVLLDDKQGASQQQMVQAVEGGIEVVEGEEAWAVRKRLFLSHLYINVISFYQDRLGTNIGKALKSRLPFSQGLTAQLQWAASVPILKWSSGSSWRKADASVSELYANFYTVPPPPPGTR